MLAFFPRDVLDGILNLLESVSEGFPTYSCNYRPVSLTCVQCKLLQHKGVVGWCDGAG